MIKISNSAIWPVEDSSMQAAVHAPPRLGRARRALIRLLGNERITSLGVARRMLQVSLAQRAGKSFSVRRLADPISAPSRGHTWLARVSNNFIRTFNAEDLIECYKNGRLVGTDLFDPRYLYTYAPPIHSVILAGDFKVPKRFSSTVRNTHLVVRLNYDYRQLIDLCAEPTQKRPYTWLGRPLRLLYLSLFERGLAHGVEVWEGEELVGGLVGIAIGGFFAFDSMVSRRPNASKLALVHLAARLNAGGFSMLDAQEDSPLKQQFGSRLIGRDDYLRRLRVAQAAQANFYALPPSIDGRQALALALCRSSGN